MPNQARYCDRLGRVSLGATSPSVRVLAPAQFAGPTLIEIPDVTAAPMRLANMLVSSGCLDEAASAIRRAQRTQDGRSRLATTFSIPSATRCRWSSSCGARRDAFHPATKRSSRWRGR